MTETNVALPSATEPPLTPFGQYQLIEKIAQGGMAEIFKGKALDLNGIERVVVIKRILPHIAASPEFVEMLIDEAKIAVMLSHGNIAQIYDLGKVAEDYFIVMEYVDGKTLSQIMKRLRTQGKQIPVACAAYLCAEVANGLDYMHRKLDEQGNLLHIVHRDISPQNVIASTAGTVKIIDFGIAKARNKISTTDSGILKGKFAYMSPEHAEGEKLDYRTDIFSLGIVLFELLTGQRLFKGKNNPETIRKVKKAKIPTPSSIRFSIPEALDQIVLRALQRDREKRYQSAHELQQDLTRFLIHHYPNFSPREIVQYLREIFPQDFGASEENEEKGARGTPRDETPLAPLIVEKGEKGEKGEKRGKEKKSELHEETVAADSAVIRTKLKEAEVFHVPEKEPPKPPPKPGDESHPSVVEFEEKTSRMKVGRLLRVMGPTVLIALLILTGGYLYRRYQKRAPTENARQVTEAPLAASPPPASLPPTPPAPERVVQAPPERGTLMIDSSPKGAHIFLNDVEINQITPAQLNQIPAGKTQKIGLHLDLYKFWEGSVQVEAGKTARLSVPLELNFGEMEINSLPAGAQVFLNGDLVGQTPFEKGKVPPETGYEVLLKLKGYEPWKGWIKVFGGKKEVLNASLRKLPADETLP